MNDLVKLRERSGSEDEKRPLQFAHSHYRKVLDRYLISILRPSSFAVLSAIYSRTLPWNKVIEVITLDTFCEGYPGVDDDGLPFFAGVNMSKNTLRAAIEELADGHFIERFAISDVGRTTHAYMPTSGYLMMCMTVSTVDWDEAPASFHNAAHARRALTAHEDRIIMSLRRFREAAEGAQTS